jgi:broad specificity phosphatase PhoE
MPLRKLSRAGIGLVAFLSIALGQSVFVRHGETVANVTGKYSDSTLNVLTAKGQSQADALVKKLPARFDAIYVSPAGRCIRTIGPYLKATNQRATIWPELLECCQQRGEARKIPAGPLEYGPKITIPSEWKAYFVIEPGHDRLINSPNYQAGLRQIRMAADRIRGLRPGQKSLFVSHSIAGARLFEALTGQPNRIKVDNASPILIDRRGDVFTVRKP